VTAFTSPATQARPAEPTGAASLLAYDHWTDEMLTVAGVPVLDAPFVTVGGGIGSFVTADYLRVVGGLGTDDIRVVSNLSHPWQTYEHLARVSQIPRDERIRSDSASRPDNLWGFPSYAVTEAVRHRTLRPLLQVLLEPVLDDFYTPRLGMVLESIEREAHRIGYWDMLVPGTANRVRRRVGGGYFTMLTPRFGPASPGGAAGLDAAEAGPVALRSRDVHVAVGYPGLRFLPELAGLRQGAGDFHHVVNAYEDHEHVYEALRCRPGSVLVRGGGIVASRVLERLIQDRYRHGLQTEIVHLLRTYVDGSHGPHPWARRRGGNGFAYQGFNYPKSAWGGVLKARMRRLEGTDRADLYDVIGGTTTAYRRSWERQQDAGRREGWYRVQTGTVEELRVDGATVLSRVQVDDGVLELRTDYVIDCTGLNADIDEHELLHDLLQHGGAGRNPLGRVDVERSFEVRGTASGEGRLYLTGAAALGGYFPGVDTFLGLQIAAQEVVDDLARRGYCRRLGPRRSTAEWFKWLAGRPV
jgi:hypothetical protein